VLYVILYKIVHIILKLFTFKCFTIVGSNTSKGPMRPDVELGRLREMPQRPTFFHAVNVGYQGAVLFQKKKKKEKPILSLGMYGFLQSCLIFVHY